MRPLALALASVAIGVAAAAQSPDREPLATISHETIERGIVSEVAWDGGTLLIQTVAMRPTGELAPRYFASPAPGMALKHLPVAPPALEDYWKNKSSRISPTGEVWAWSPARLNRIAYVDGGGDLWIAHRRHGRRTDCPRRLHAAGVVGRWAAARRCRTEERRQTVGDFRAACAGAPPLVSLTEVKG
jgi:hypothetical protein